MNKVTDVLSFVNKHDVKFIRVSIIDLLGQKRSVELPMSSLTEVRMNRVMCDSSSIKGGSLTEDSDRAIKVDESSAALSSDGTLEIYGSLYDKKGNYVSTDSRFILNRQVQILQTRGYTMNVGLEPEFYLLSEDNLEPIDSEEYFSLESGDLSAKIRRSAVENLMKEGYLIGPFHHEVGPGQCEINFAFADAVTAADRLYRYKEIIKQTASSNESIATFYPKPFKDLPGSGMHLNCSLASLSGVNMFYDPNNVEHLSTLSRQAVSGLLYHSPALCALACTIENSYNRLHSGLEASGKIFWSHLNRSAALRIPSATAEKTRIELRYVDNTSNLYLLLAGIIASILDGIDHPLREFDKDESQNKVLELPHSLGEALEFLSKDEIIVNALGKETIEKYINYKSQEIGIEVPLERAIKQY